MQIRYALIFVLAALLLGGCATYRAMPITGKAVEENLSPPGKTELRLRAASITHPVLESVDLDTSDGLSPDEAAVLAVILNPALRAERDRKGIAGAETIRAGILPNPRLSYSFEIPVGGIKPDTINAYGLGLGWDIGALVTREAKLDAARAQFRSVELDIAWKEWQVAEKAKLGLYLYAIARQRAVAVAEREKRLSKIYALTKRAVGLGVNTSQDLARARFALEEVRSFLIKARADLEAKRLGLNLAIGLPGETRITPEMSLDTGVFSVMPAVEALMKGIEDNRLDIKALRLGYKSEEARLRAAILSQFPSIKIGPIGAKDTDGVKTAGGLLDVEVPLFNRNQGRIALERATRKRLFDEYIARLFEARIEVARLAAELTSMVSRIEEARGAVKNMEDRAALYEKALKSGAFGALDYYRFLSDLDSRRLQMLDLKEEAALEAVSLETASGRYIFRKSKNAGQSPDRTKKVEVLK